MKRIFVAVDMLGEAWHKFGTCVETMRKEFPRIRVGRETIEKQLKELKIIVEDISNYIANCIFQTGIPNASNSRVLWFDFVDEQGS